MHECRGRCVDSAMRSDGSKSLFMIILHDNMHLHSIDPVKSFLVSVRGRGEKVNRRREGEAERRM